MIVMIAEQFTSDPSDRERSPTIIWKPGLTIVNNHMETESGLYLAEGSEKFHFVL